MDLQPVNLPLRRVVAFDFGGTLAAHQPIDDNQHVCRGIRDSGEQVLEITSAVNFWDEK